MTKNTASGKSITQVQNMVFQEMPLVEMTPKGLSGHFVNLKSITELLKINNSHQKLFLSYKLIFKRSVILIIYYFVNMSVLMEQRALKNVNNCLNTDIYSYLVTPGG